jgi:hypothetical protein
MTSKHDEKSSTAARGCACALFALVAGATACSRQPQPYVPGFGEIMTLTQMRHAKLWLAGDAGNWPLAAYELDELKEGFDDLVAYHPTHKEAPVPIPQVVEKMMTVPLKDLDAAVSARDRERFTRAFDDLTRGCNGCHQATNFGFNVVTRPTGNPYVNQLFPPQ